LRANMRILAALGKIIRSDIRGLLTSSAIG